MARLDWQKRLIEYCEELEEHADFLNASADANEHQIGFACGQRIAAKKLRREIGEVFHEWQTTNPTFIYGH